MAHAFRSRFPRRSPMRDFPMPGPRSDEFMNTVEEPEIVPIPKNEPFQLVTLEHSSGILEKLCKQREEGMFIDCTVTTDSYPIPAHQSVLSAVIPYVDRLLRFKQEQEHDERHQTHRTVDLSEFDHRSVAALIDYAYRGEIVISPENVRDLLPIADFLCMDAVSSACVTFLDRNVDIDTWPSILHFAFSMNNATLINLVKLFILRRFFDVIETKEFLQIEPEFLIEILCSDELLVTEKFTRVQPPPVCEFFVVPGRQEELILRSVMRYASSDSERKINEGLLIRILSEGVRLPLIPVDVLESLRSQKLFAGSTDCLAIFDKAIRLGSVRAQVMICSKPSKSNPLETLLIGCVTGACSQGSLDVSMDSALGEDQDLEEGACSHWTVPRSLTGVLAIKLTKELANNDPYAQFTGEVREFDDSELGLSVQYVTGMKLYMRRWDGRKVIGGMLVTYNDSTSILHGTDDYGHEEDGFILDPDERITSVFTQTGFMVDALKFTTNKGRVLGPYGGPGGGTNQFLAPGPSAYLSHIKGKVQITQEASAVRHIQFAWAYNNYTKATY